MNYIQFQIKQLKKQGKQTIVLGDKAVSIIQIYIDVKTYDHVRYLCKALKNLRVQSCHWRLILVNEQLYLVPPTWVC